MHQNRTIPSENGSKLSRHGYEARLENTMDVTPVCWVFDQLNLNYENNILGLDAVQLLTGYLASECIWKFSPSLPNYIF